MIETGFPNVQDKGRIVAHRGASQVAPENTLAAFATAQHQGTNWIEFDVSLLGDKTPIVHHDETIDRCTTGSGKVSELSLADLQGISAGKLHGKPFSDERLPTLDQTLDLLETTGMYANLEIKTHNEPLGALAGRVRDALANRSWAADRVVVSSFDLQELAAFRAAMPEIPVAALWDRPPSDFRQTLSELRAAALHLHFSHLSQSLLQEAISYGFDVRVFTVNQPKVLVPFRDLGLTSVITDHPPLFLNDPEWAAWASG